MYVDDDTYSGACTSDTKAECFFQVLAFYGQVQTKDYNDLVTQCMYFSQNTAYISGSTLYGGLLDRCAVCHFAEVYKMYPHDYKDINVGITYFENVSVITNLLHVVWSSPVRVCLRLCGDSIPAAADCSRHGHIEVKKGETFNVVLAAVDQVGHPISATIQTSLHFTESGLAEGQLARKISAECTYLIFNVVSLHDSESLTLYASDGP